MCALHDQSILLDYQQSYDLTRTLTTSLRHATERDARLDLLEASLSGVDAQGKKDPGALKLLLRSSGAQPGIDNRGSSSTRTQGKGKIVSHTPPITSTSQLDAVATTIPNLDSKVNQVLDIFPEQPGTMITSRYGVLFRQLRASNQLPKERIFYLIALDLVELPTCSTGSTNPLVLGTFTGNQGPSSRLRPRLLFYGHYDVFPAPPRGWNSDPFAVDGKNGYLYGRGVTDNKGPIIASAFAAAELLCGRSLGVNVVFLIEGEEECGSVNFSTAIEKYKDQIGHIDAILVR
ncbi:hypothetical protein D9757_015478 [Collybiopsis confluens]|uniref:Uncharacterized protein n=1 Tax=Collybiopsis confluens TaxID=2823264 RepID=A0A8H5FND7_9AGAR|nr:hypothetical protein D9757_015478 [Collybiopsis confluens]